MSSYLDNIIIQTIGASVEYLNSQRIKDFFMSIDKVIKTSDVNLNVLSNNFDKAIKIIDQSKVNIGDTILKNRGGERGLHGFIAEEAEVAISNARQVFGGLKEIAFKLDDNSKVDLIVNGKNIQMKANNNVLDSIKFSEKYMDMDMMYMKDKFNIIDRVMKGDKQIIVDGTALSANKIENIKRAVLRQETIRNESYDNWLKPSKLSYKSVQVNKIDQTLKFERDDLKMKFFEERSSIENNRHKQIENARLSARHTFSEAHKVATSGAILSGAIGLGISLYEKNKQGKKPWEFDIDDWTEVGYDFGKSMVKGYVSGHSIYY